MGIGNSARFPLGSHLVFCRPDVAFMKAGLAGMSQDLVNAATEHNVAAQNKEVIPAIGTQLPRT